MENEKVSLQDQMVAACVKEIHVNGKEILAIRCAKEKLAELGQLRKQYVDRLEKLRAKSKEPTGSKGLNVDAIKGRLEKKNGLLVEIQLCEEAMAELDKNILPDAKDECSDTEGDLMVCILPILRRQQSVWQEKVNGLAAEIDEITESWRQAVHAVRCDPDFVSQTNHGFQEFGKLEIDIDRTNDIMSQHFVTSIALAMKEKYEGLQAR